jgi:uncharacterized protein YndB with AHSA1/START domain
MASTPDSLWLRIVRRFDVPPDKVFDALTNPDAMRIWCGDDTIFDIDLRVGGRWTITRRQDGTDYTAVGEYRVIERPRRLSYTFAMPQFSPNSDTISVEIARDGTGQCRHLRTVRRGHRRRTAETPAGRHVRQRGGLAAGVRPDGFCVGQAGRTRRRI